MKLNRIIAMFTIAVAAFATSAAHGTDDLKMTIRTADDQPLREKSIPLPVR
jgi:hypothetical protein